MYENYIYYINEILDQIIFWTEISKEHPIVINTVANLTNKSLPEELIHKIGSFTQEFGSLQDETKELQGVLYKENHYAETQMEIVKKTKWMLQKFISIDRQWIHTLQKVDDYGKEDKVWQTLLQHIAEEQTYALELMRSYKKNIY